MKLVLCIIWALFMVAAVWAMVHSVKKTRAQERLIASWPKVQGRITGSRQARPAGRKIPRGTSAIGTPTNSWAPADPHQSFRVDSPSKLLLGCVIPVLVLPWLAAFWFIGVH